MRLLLKQRFTPRKQYLLHARPNWSKSVEIYVPSFGFYVAHGRDGESGLALTPSREDLAVVWSTSRSLHDALHKCHIQCDVYRIESTDFSAAAATRQ